MTNHGLMRGIGALIILSCLIILPDGALAQSGEQLLHRAKDNYKLGNYEKSIKELKQVLASSSNKEVLGRAHLYLALNHALLGNLNKTRNHFMSALKTSPVLTIDPQRVKARTYTIFQEIRKSFAGVIEVAADKPGAKVYIDKKMVGTVPYQGKISIGRHQLRVESVDGKEDYIDENLIVGARESRAVMAKLEPIKGYVAITTKPSGATILAGGEPMGQSPKIIRIKPGKRTIRLKLDRHQEVEKTLTVSPGKKYTLSVALKFVPGLIGVGGPWKPPSFFKRKTTWAVITLSVGVMLASVGIVYGVNAKRAEDAFHCGGDNACSGGNMSVEKANDYKESASTFARNANIFFISAGVAGATSLILFLLRDKPPATKQAGSFQLRPLIGVGSMGLMGELRF